MSIGRPHARSVLQLSVDVLLLAVLLLLFVLIFIEIISGVVISAVALPAFGIRTINDRSWRALHNLTLNWTLLVIGLHVAMNWHPIVAGFRRHIRPGPQVRE